QWPTRVAYPGFFDEIGFTKSTIRPVHHSIADIQSPASLVPVLLFFIRFRGPQREVPIIESTPAIAAGIRRLVRDNARRPGRARRAARLLHTRGQAGAAGTVGRESDR